MKLYEGGTFLVDRDEQKVIKKAAFHAGDYQVAYTLGHYLGVRLASSQTLGEVKLKVKPLEMLTNPYLEEASWLPELLVRVEESPSIVHMRYVYGPELARRSLNLVAAADMNIYSRELDLQVAKTLAELAMPPVETISTRH